MKFTWLYSKTQNQEFPEEYSIVTPKNDRIKIEVNKFRSIVNIKLKTENNDLLQSTIHNGMIIREKDLITQKPRNLDKDFRKVHWEVSTLPDDRVLRIIAGNYGVYTRTMASLEVKDQNKIQSLLNLKSVLKTKFIDKIKSIRKWVINFIKNIFHFPKYYDIIDFMIFGGLAYAIYSINFNLFIAGLIAAIGALISGYSDLLFRKKEPYILKIIFLFFPGIFAVYVGFMFQ